MSEEAEHPQIRTSPYLSPMHQYGTSIVALTNPENEMYKMELAFRSMTIDEDGTPKQTGLPLMNDFGISSVIGTVQSVVSQITVLSNVDRQEVNKIMMYLSETLIKDMMINRVNYGIESFSSRSKILQIAETTAFLCLKRGYMEGEKRFLKGSQQEIRNVIEGPNKKQSLFPWNRN